MYRDCLLPLREKDAIPPSRRLDQQRLQGLAGGRRLD